MGAPLWPLALARMAIGVLWLFSLRWKLPPTFAPPAGVRGLADWMTLMTQHPVVADYGAFVETIVLPNFTLFAWLIFLAELAAGLSLLLGLQVRVGMTDGNERIVAYPQPGDAVGEMSMLTDAGRVLGLDARASGRP